MAQSIKPLTVSDILAMKEAGEKIACLTAYDASFAAVLDQAGIDVILVGDSLGMVIQGQSSTVPVSIRDMVYHCQCVSRGRKRAFLVADLPFMTYSTPAEAAKNAARLLQRGGAQMVKLEGAHADCIEFLVRQGIPVCGHLGLLPQSINQIGGYHIQGREQAQAEQILDQAHRIQQAGAAMLVLECVPASLAGRITSELSIPVIGIGAGADCDGQVLVLYDLLNLGTGKYPRFVKNFLGGGSTIAEAISAYRQAVKNKEFPGPEHSY